MMDDFQITGGVEAVHLTGFDEQLGHFEADVNLTITLDLSASIQGYDVIFQSVNLVLNNLSANFYGCLNDDKCKQIKEEFTTGVINDIIFVVQTVINTYFTGHPFKIPSMQIGSYFDVETPYLAFKEHFMELGFNIVAK